MKRWKASGRLGLLLGTLAVGAVQLSAHAETSVSYTLGNSTGGYVSHAIEAGVDIKVIPVEVRVDATVANSGDTEVLNQYGVALTWRPIPLVSLKYRRSGVKDTIFNVSGNELGASLYFDGLLKDKLETRLDFGFTALDYGLRANLPAAEGLVPDQRRQSFGFRQDLTPGLSLYATYEQYSYSLDPVAIARFLVTRRKPRVNAAFSLVDFPDRARSYGVSWGATDKLDLDMSVSQSDSVIAQQQRTLRLAGTWAVNSKANLTLAFSQTVTGGIFLPSGVPLIDEQRGSTVELTLGWNFN
jgi:hypothetical protein